MRNFPSDSSLGGNGVTISGSSGCQLNAFTASGNAGVGVALINAKKHYLNRFQRRRLRCPRRQCRRRNCSCRIILKHDFEFCPAQQSGPGVTLTNSSKNWVFSFDATGSTSSSGVELSGSSSNFIFDFTTLDNAFYGVWLAASSSNSVRFGLALGNTLAGVYLGCGASGVGSCSPGGQAAQ